jgi:ketosteroid isomerase-like protein
MMASLVALALAAAPLPESTSTPEAAAASFLDAFKSMDEARFKMFFAPDVTMFFPDGPFPHGRVEGRDAVLSAFRTFFKLVKERGRMALNIVPLEQRVQLYGDVAVVTFRLDGDETVGRRSIIFRNIGGDWRIAHFHASTIEK